MHAAVWGISAVALIIVAAGGALGGAGQWCWIRDESGWARLFFYFLPLLAVLWCEFARLSPPPVASVAASV